METFTEWLLVALEERGMSQSDLANAAGIGRGSISDIVSGRRKVGKDLATAIANGLKLPPEQVFRAAGLLPPTKKHNEEIEQIVHEVEGMSKDEQLEVLSYVRWRANQRKKK